MNGHRYNTANALSPVDVVHNIENQLHFILAMLELDAKDQADASIAEIRLLLAELAKVAGIPARNIQGRTATMIRDRMDQLLWEWSTHLITCRQCVVWDLGKDIKRPIVLAQRTTDQPKLPTNPCEKGKAIVLRMVTYLHNVVA